MLNPEPLQFRWHRLALGPALLLVLALAVAGAVWFQQAKPAGADIEEDPYYYHLYEGTATVKVKNGNAYSTYPVYTCTLVETDGPDGAMTDVMIFGYNVNQDFGGSDVEEVFCGDMICICEGDPNSTIESNSLPELLPGTFIIATYIDETLTGGIGWKANPVKMTATQWKFTVKTALAEAAGVVLNNDLRPLQPNTTLIAKFIRERGGLYWKVAGTAPLTSNLNPKVTVEIESPITGHDSAPWVVSSTPDWFSEVDSDTSMTVQFSEPVNIDPEGVELYCQGEGGEYFEFTISGQGTSTIVIDPVLDLPYGDYCDLYIYPEAITDVDTHDPPDHSIEPVYIPFYVNGPPG